MKFAERLLSLFMPGASSGQLFDDLCDLLIEGDIGATLALKVTEELKSICHRSNLRDERKVKEALKDVLIPYTRMVAIEPSDTGTNCLLVLGVNGVGKTTTIAKLAQYYSRKNHIDEIILAAGDTFRAAAIEQLKIHGDRLGARVIAHKQGADPGAVIFDALEAAAKHKNEMVIADTAGRMHTKQNLVSELSKIDRIIKTKIPSDSYRKLLVIDATTGRNAIAQAEVFKEAIDIDALIVTKCDSTAKGGIVLAAAEELGLPTAFLGWGERYDELTAFDSEDFLDDFLGLK